MIRKRILRNSRLNLWHVFFSGFRFLLLIILSGYFFIMQAQDKPEKKWNFTVAPYLMFPTINGDITVKGVPLNINANTGDVFDYLDFAFMIYGEMSSKDWAITLDALYMKLGGQTSTPLTSRGANFNMSQLAITPTGMYRLCSWAEAGIGLRINSISSSVTIEPGENILQGIDVEESATWVDPLIVLRVMQTFNDEKWRLGLYSDVGGFGLGSELTWQVYPFAGYRFSKLFEMDLAWRWLGIDYEKGSETDYFKYDMVINGPEIGFLFHF